MSIEQIVLLLFLVVLPLVQYLIRQARERMQLGGQDEEDLPPLTSLPPMREQRVPAINQEHRTPSEVISLAGTPAGKPADKRSGRPAPRKAAVLDRRKAFDLRRAIVLMTVVGPCRAASPHDWPNPAGGR
jgi:hypothetical protein